MGKDGCGETDFFKVRRYLLHYKQKYEHMIQKQADMQRGNGRREHGLHVTVLLVVER